MNIFILCTGRCGSFTFIQACRHMTNFSAGHETRSHRLGPERLAFPDNHIEADNRLCWFLGRLDRAFGDTAYYVHLMRDPDEVARSWASRFLVPGGMAAAYRDGILVDGAHPGRPISRLESSIDYVETVTENIRLFLKDKSNVLEFRLEHAAQDFDRFWHWIGAEGCYDAALAEWSVRHNDRDWWRSRRPSLRDHARRIRRAMFPPP